MKVPEIYNLTLKKGISLKVINNELEVVFNKEINNLNDIIELIRNNKQGLIEYINEITCRQSYKKDGIPLTPFQSSVLSLSLQSHINHLSYNIYRSFNLGSVEVDILRLEKSVKSLLIRHEALRIVVKKNNSENYKQYVLDIEDIEPDFTLFDKVDCPEEVWREFAEKPFDFEKGLIRFCLIQCVNGENILGYVIHHIISDAKSINIIEKELVELYSNNAELKELNEHFTDFAIFLNNVDYARSKDFWKNKNLTDCRKIDLSAYKEKKCSGSHRGYAHDFKIDKINIKSIIENQKKYGISVFSSFTSLISIVFYKLFDINHIVFTIPVSIRDLLQHNAQIGSYINSIPLRVDINGYENFKELSHRINSDFIECLDNRIYPLSYISNDLGIDKKLFNISLVLHNDILETSTYAKEVKFNKTSSTSIVNPKNDLTIELNIDNECLYLHIEHKSDFISRHLMKIIINTLLKTIEEIEHSDAQINLLNVISDGDIRKIKDYSGKEQFIELGNSNIIKLFKENVLKNPKKIALINNEVQYSYYELDIESENYAKYLFMRYNLKKGDVVTLLMNKSDKLIISIFALLKLGCIYTPLDNSYPEKRISFLIKICNSVITLDDITYEEYVNTDSQRYLNFQLEENITQGKDPVNIMFTSGSTGEPNGALITNNAIIRLVKSKIIPKKEITLLSTGSVSFDAVTFEYFYTLLNGGQLVITEKERILDTNLFKTEILEKQINSLWLTSELFNRFVENQIDVFATIKYLVVGGDIVSVNHVEKVYGLYKNIHIVNGYGPTENTTFSLVYEIKKNTKYTSIPIGTPIINTSVYILDNNMQYLPPGIIGEIYLGGDGLALGYLNKELTRKKFIYHDSLKCILYKTGDLGRWDSDGNMIFEGRKDFQVKLRGIRVELEEIDHQINCIEGVKAAHTLLIGTKLVAFIKMHNQVNDQLQASLRNILSENLPSNIIPNHFIIINEFPINVNGKIDRNKLVDLYEEKIKMVKEEKKDSTAINTQLIELWANALEIPFSKIDINKNFFENGGDSLTMLNVISKLKNIGINITFDQFMSNPTIKYIQDLATSKESVSTTYQIAKSDSYFLLSPIQQWFFKINPSNHNFLMHLSFELHADFDINKLQDSISKVCNANTSFRLRYHKKDNMYFQKYDWAVKPEELYFFVNHNNNKNIGEEDCISESMKIINSENGPLLYVAIINENIIFLSCSHLIIDAISWNILLSEIDNCYNHGYILDKKETYKQWVENCMLNINSNLSLKELSFWCRQKENLQLPINRCTKEHSYLLKVMTSTKLFNNEIENIILTAIIFELSNYLSSNEIVIEKESHGRTQIGDYDVSNTIGWFTSKYPIKFEINSKNLFETFEKVIATNESIPNSGIYFDKYKYLTGDYIKKNLGGHPKFSFNYLGNLGNSNSSTSNSLIKKVVSPLTSSIDRGNFESIKNNSNYWLDVNSWQINDELHISFKASSLLGISDDEWNDFIKNIYNNCLLLINENHNQKMNNNFKLSPFQKGILAYMKVNPESDNYYVQWEYKINRHIDYDKFREACSKLLDEVDILKTRYDYDINAGGYIVDIIQPDKVECNLLYIGEGQIKAQCELIKKEKFKADSPFIKFNILRTNESSDIIVITVHHIILDGSSMYMMLNRLLYIYQCLLSNVRINRSDNVQFDEYLKWIYRQDINSSLFYWKNLLSSYKPSLVEYFTVGSNNIDTFIEKKYSINITKQLIDYLNKNGVTLSSVLNYITGETLSKYLNQPKFIWGNMVTFRPNDLVNFDKVIGPCISTIPIAFDFNYKKENRISNIKSLQKQIFESRAHSYLSLNEILTSLSSNKLFDVLFTYQNYKKTNNSYNQEIDIESIHENVISSHFPLTIMVNEEKSNKLIFRVRYSNKYLQDFFVENWVTVILDELNRMCEDKGENQISNELLSIVEGEVDEDDFTDSYLHIEFDKIAKLQGDSIAVYDDTKSLTYEQVRTQSNFISEMIQSKITENGCVAISMTENVNVVPIIIGILRTGCYFVNLDKDFPLEKVDEIKELTKPILYITDNKNNKLFDDMLFIEGNIPETYQTTKTSYNDVLTLNYTSGSTGSPKMVIVNHKSHLSRLRWLKKRYPAEKNDAYILKTSLSFAPALREIFEPLLQGKSLFIPRRELFKDMEYFLNTIYAKNITRIYLTPSYLNMIIANNKTGLLSKIKILEISGEPMSEALFDKLKILAQNGTKLLNRFGSTEVASVIYYDISESKHGNLAHKLLGKPIHNTKIVVCDKMLNIVPKGVLGEICINSDCLSLGYWSNKEDTLNKFVMIMGQKYIRMGDLGYIDNHNNVYYYGRINRMTKIRGYRIELGEIENTIKKLKDVNEAIAISSNNDNTSQIILFYTVTAKLFDENVIWEKLKNTLPTYSLPSRIIRLDKVPLTPNNKIDFEELKRFVNRVKNVDNKNLSIWEAQMIEIISKIVGHNNFALEDNLFNIGLDSIKAMQLSYEVGELFSKKIPPNYIYKHCTISSIIENMSESKVENYVEINKSGMKRLYIIPPAGNTRLDYDYISKITPRELNIIIFDPVNLLKDGNQSIEFIAKETAEQIISLSQNRKINICGWSLGATIAFEVSNQIRVKNLDVNSIILLDPGFYNPHYDSAFSVEKLKEYLKVLLPDNQKITDEYISQQIVAQDIISRYKPKLLNQEVVLFKPAQVESFERNYLEPFNQLDKYCSNIKIERINGNHMTMMNDIESILKLIKKHIS